MPRAVFLDRDGVINKKVLKVGNAGKICFLPGVAEAIALLRVKQLMVFVVSNQRCVAKGLLSEAELNQLHRRMLEHLSAQGAVIDAIYYCPHDLQPPCTCRKPAPGMILRAASDHFLDLPNSWVVGDSDIDIEAGKSASCKTARILRDGVVPQTQADLFVGSLLEAARRIVRT